jgi:hypothetical protein
MEAAVEQGRILAEHPQQPHEPARHGAAGVVVRDDRRSVADSDGGEPGGEPLRSGQGVATLLGGRRVGEDDVHVDAHRSGQMAGRVGVGCRSAIEVVARIDDDGFGVPRQPGAVDDGRNHVPTLAPRATRDAERARSVASDP